MDTDEIQTLKLALSAASHNGVHRRASYFIGLGDGEWVVHVETSLSFRVSQSTGMLIPDDLHLDASEALRIAREYAVSHQLRWEPAFSLEPERGGWKVGARQSQLGGQLFIDIGSDGRVLEHRVNPR
ncbi:hypothetical protein DyAD56_02170 [Dyella sp. AD56]|uniref:hypothetical protein n=1 Tax=Dyella sp. AD56 TaxID=1528744 RepID=UPI000C8611F0|nr:hypothetical protein [Dyella sp. AD56]PMQ07552.1 hypothetical protein DyAD56_02170 [Dyella sp. AD56]